MGFCFLFGTEDQISFSALVEHTLVYAKVANTSTSKSVWWSTTWFLPTSSIATHICLYVITYMSFDIPHQHIPHPQHVWWRLLLLLLLFLFFFFLLEVEEDVHFTWKNICICKDKTEIEISYVWCLLHVHFLFVCIQICLLHVIFLFRCIQKYFMHVIFLFVCK